MKNVLNNDTLRRIEMTALILENPGTYSENDLSEYFDDISVQTIRRDAAFLREMGVNIIMKVKVRISYEFISWLMGWGGDVKVLKPQSLIDTLLSKSEEITDCYK